MKRFIFIISVLIFSVNSFAQDLYTFSSSPGFNSKIYKKKIVTNENIFSTDVKNYHFWNFSKLKSDSTKNFVFEIIKPQNCPDYFIKSNYCLLIKEDSTLTYIFEQINNSSFKAIGDIYYDGKYKSVTKYDSKDTMTFKFSNDTIILCDTSSKWIYENNNIITFVKNIQNTKNINNAYGKIKLPNHKIYKTFLIKYYSTIYDSIFVNNEYLYSDTSNYEYFSWYTVNKLGSLILIADLYVKNDKYYFTYSDKLDIKGIYKGELEKGDE